MGLGLDKIGLFLPSLCSQGVRLYAREIQVFFFFFYDLFIIGWCWVFIVARWLSLVVVCGLFTAVASLVAEHRLQAHGLQ